MFWKKWSQARVNRERVLAFDLLRGAFLIEIISFHLIWSPSLIIFIGGNDRLPASAAEGFFAISGLLVGYLYGPKVLQQTKKVFIKIWRRALLLYGLTVLFTLLYTVWAILEPDSVKHAIMWSGDPLTFLYETLTLRYTFGWADFLARYAVFMMVAPFAIWLIAKGRAWIVALASAATWFFFRHTDIFLPYSAWQIIFMYSIILGYYLPHIEAWFRSLSRTYRHIIVWIVCSTAFVTYALSIVSFVVIPILHPDNYAVTAFNEQLMAHFDKDHIDPARLAIGVLWFAALYIVVRRYEKAISRYTRGVLEVFGRQSLFVYSFHAFLLFAVDLYFAPITKHSFWQNNLVTLAVLLIIYIAASNRIEVSNYFKKLYRDRSTTQIP